MTPRVLYLDTSDLSHLAREYIVDGVNYGSLRNRISAVSKGSHMRLRLSFIQLAEATQLRNSEVFAEGMGFLRSLPGVTISLVRPDSIFMAEHDQVQVELREVPLSIVPHKLYDSRLSILSHLWPLFSRTIVRAQRRSPEARSDDTASVVLLFVPKGSPLFPFTSFNI